MPRIGRLVAALALGLAVLLVTAAPASAHATLVEAVPADGSRVATGPDTVVLRFSEDVGVSGDSVRVLATSGDRVDDGRPRTNGTEVTIGIEGDLAPDTYVVAWRVVSADDHPIHGATTFIVGDGERASSALIQRLLGDQGDGVWPWLGAIARALAYAGGLVVIGVAAWLAFVERGPASRGTARVVLSAAIVGAVGALATVPVQAALSTGLGFDGATDTSILVDVIGSALGWGVAITVVGLALAAVAARRSAPLTMAGAALVAIGFARSGHTETTDPRVVAFVADVVHVLAAGAWLGGLTLLALELRASRHGSRDPATVVVRVDRFSALAAVVSITAAGAGAVLAWGTVRHLDALTSTTYGRTLLVKTALVALVGVAAAYNHWRLVPAVHDGETGAQSVLHRTVRLEVVGLLAVVAVTAALVNIEPARLAAGGGLYERTVAFGDGTAVVQVDPARAGENAVHVYLLDATGGQLDLLEEPTFSFTLAAAEIGPIERTPYRAGPGHYTLDGPEMSQRGTWTIEVRGRITQFEEATATVLVPVR